MSTNLNKEEEEDVLVESLEDYNKKNKNKKIKREIFNEKEEEKEEISNIKKEGYKIIKETEKSNNKNNKLEITDEEIKNRLRFYDPPAIKDFPKIPYKSICIVFLLLFSSIFFLYCGVLKYKEGDTWYNLLSYFLLGSLLFIPGTFYTFILINILIGRKGYKYEDIPDLSN